MRKCDGRYTDVTSRRIAAGSYAVEETLHNGSTVRNSIFRLDDNARLLVRYPMPFCIDRYVRATKRHDATEKDIAKAIYVTADMRSGVALSRTGIPLAASDGQTR
jgi:hypothetical protein